MQELVPLRIIALFALLATFTLPTTAACAGNSFTGVITPSSGTSVDRDRPEQWVPPSAVGHLGSGAEVTILCRTTVKGAEQVDNGRPIGAYKIDSSVGTGYVLDSELAITSRHSDGGQVDSSEIPLC